MRGEGYLYQLSEGSFWVDDPVTGTKRGFTKQDIIAGMTYGGVSRLGCLFIYSLLNPAFDEGRVLRYREDIKATKGARYNKSEVYRKLILLYVQHTEVSNEFTKLVADHATWNGWKVRGGRESLATLCNIVLLEKLYPVATACERCSGSGLVASKKCTSCAGERSQEGPTGLEYVGSGTAKLSNAAHGKLLDVTGKCYGELWEARKREIESLFDHVLKNGMLALSDGVRGKESDNPIPQVGQPKASLQGTPLTKKPLAPVTPITKPTGRKKPIHRGTLTIRGLAHG